MDCWSAENATKAYLNTLRMGERCTEPNVAEFISALAAGNNARKMVVASEGAANPAIILALLTAAQQTRGQVSCIVRGTGELLLTRKLIGHKARSIQFLIGEPQELLSGDPHCSESDFVLVDCNLDNHEKMVEEILRETSASLGSTGRVVVGYNAFSKGSWRFSGFNTQLLPIGSGLLVSRVDSKNHALNHHHVTDGSNQGYANMNRLHSRSSRRKSHWIVKVDKCTGEEHVYRVRSAQGREIQA